MKKYNLKSKLLKESPFASADRSSDTSGLKGAIGGGAAQYIVSSYISKQTGISISVTKGDGGIETAGVSTGAPDVKVPYNGKDYEIEVKHGSGRFDLQTVIESQLNIKVSPNQSFKKPQADAALAAKIKRDSILVICEGSGVEGRPNMGMSYMYVLGISDSTPPTGEGEAIDSATAKKLFGVNIPFLTALQIAQGVTQNTNASTRKDKTRIERSISEANMVTLGAKKIMLNVAGVVSPAAAHTTFVSKYLQVEGKSPQKYREELARKLGGITANEILCMQVATYSDGSSAFASCWNSGKGIYIPIIPNVGKDKYAPFVQAIKTDLPSFRKRFKEIMEKAYTPAMTVDEVIRKAGGISSTGGKSGPDAVDKTLSRKPGTKSSKKKAKKTAVKAFDNAAETPTTGFLEVLESMAKSAIKKASSAANKLLATDEKIKGMYASGADVQKIAQAMDDIQRRAFSTAIGIEFEELEETEDTAVEELVDVADNASTDEIAAVISTIRNSTAYRGKKLQTAYDKYSSRTPPEVPTRRQSVTAGKTKDNWGLPRYKGIVAMLEKLADGDSWRQAFPTPASFASQAEKRNKIDIDDFNALLKRENRMYGKKYSLLENLGLTDNQTELEVTPAEMIATEPSADEPSEIEVTKPTQNQELDLLQTQLMNDLEAMDNKTLAQFIIDDFDQSEGILEPKARLNNIMSDVLDDIFQEPSSNEAVEEYD